MSTSDHWGSEYLNFDGKHSKLKLKDSVRSGIAGGEPCTWSKVDLKALACLFQNYKWVSSE